MMHVTYPINNLPRALPLCLGVQSEYGARPISIDVSAWVERWPDIVVSIQPVRPGETAAYPAVDVTREGNVVTWTPNAYDTEIPGTGQLEVIGLADGVKIIRAGASTTIAATVTSTSKEPEEPLAAWADSVIKAGEQAKVDAGRAEDAADAAAEHAGSAELSESAAKGAAVIAEEQAALAETARTSAEQSLQSVRYYEQQAARSRYDAQQYRNEAQKAQTAAEAAATMAESSASTAQAAKNAAETAAEQAKKSASEASTHKTQAVAASNAATMAASAAAKSETAAREAADSVAGGVEAANTAAQNAAKSAQAAASSADGVKDAEKAAEASATLAGEKATQVQGAAASAEQAKNQAVSAADKATAAQTAAEKAGSEASAAAATAATAQAAAAADAKTASSAATTASTAAQAAGNSAANASDSALAAQSSAEAAADAQATAEAAATRAEVVRNSIPEEYTALSEAVRLKAPAIICEVSGDIVTIYDAAEGAALSLVSHIEAVQEGAGDPSPKNARPISGWNQVAVNHQDQTLSADLPEPVYGGTRNWSTGLLTVTRKIIAAAAMSGIAKQDGYDHVYRWRHGATLIAGNAICSHLRYGSTHMDKEYSFYVNNSYIYMTILSCSTAEEATTWLIDNGVVFCGTLSSPYTIQLAPQQLDLLKGTNNVWSSTGKTDLQYIADTKLYIDNALSAIAASVINA